MSNWWWNWRYNLTAYGLRACRCLYHLICCAILIASLTYFEHFLFSPLEDGLLMKRKATGAFRDKFTVVLNRYTLPLPPRKISADDQTHPPAVVFSLPPPASSEAGGVQHPLVLTLILRVGRRPWPARDLEHVPALGQQTLVENQGR